MEQNEWHARAAAVREPQLDAEFGEGADERIIGGVGCAGCSDSRGHLTKKRLEMKSYEEVSDFVDKNDGIATFEMWQLRDAHGAGKLGINVVANISEELEKRGLGHQPRSLPQNQNESARVYRRGSTVGKIMEATRKVDAEADRFLRAISANDAADTLKKIKELVCD
jgi:hypothetical protein